MQLPGLDNFEINHYANMRRTQPADPVDDLTQDARDKWGWMAERRPGEVFYVLHDGTLTSALPAFCLWSQMHGISGGACAR